MCPLEAVESTILVKQLSSSGGVIIVEEMGLVLSTFLRRCLGRYSQSESRAVRTESWAVRTESWAVHAESWAVSAVIRK